MSALIHPTCRLPAAVWGALWILLLPCSAISQDAPEPPQESDIEQKLREMEQRFNERIESLENNLANQKTQNQEQKETIEQLQTQTHILEEKDDSFENAAMEELTESNGESFDLAHPISVYGFFDLTFYRLFADDASSYNLYMMNKASFFMSQVNLYFMSQMTQTLSALVEVGLSFAPHGYEKQFEYIGVQNGQELPVQGEYIRVDTTTRDRLRTQHFRQGGMTIERAHLSYTPVDWLNVIAGRYLTPYGIWNVEHGSPVILTAWAPFLQTQEIVPLAQTGIQLYGRFFPADSLSFEYAATVSNGRGPISEVFDYDDNKGLGLRLKLTYDKGDFQVSAGGYGYYGTYTDLKKGAVVQLAPDLSVDVTSPRPVQSRITITEEYAEYLASADVMIQFRGLKLQGECVWKYVDYSSATQLTEDHVMFQGGKATDVLYMPSYTGLGMYGLLSWELPLYQWIAPVRITPYFMAERTSPMDTDKVNSFILLVAGINVKPSPFVVLKAEYTHGRPMNETMFSDYGNFVTLQMAVSF